MWSFTSFCQKIKTKLPLHVNKNTINRQSTKSSFGKDHWPEFQQPEPSSRQFTFVLFHPHKCKVRLQLTKQTKKKELSRNPGDVTISNLLYRPKSRIAISRFSERCKAEARQILQECSGIVVRRDESVLAGVSALVGKSFCAWLARTSHALKKKKKKPKKYNETLFCGRECIAQARWVVLLPQRVFLLLAFVRAWTWKGSAYRRDT